MTEFATPLQPNPHITAGETSKAMSGASASEERQNVFAPRLPRNAISRKLPEAIQYRISEILHASKSYVAVREDAEIMEACASRGVTLHDATLKAWMNTEEYQGYEHAHSLFSKEMARRKLAVQMIQHGDDANRIAEEAQYKLLRVILQKIDNGEAVDKREMQIVSQALAQQQKMLQVDKAAEERAKFAERESAYQAQIAELSAKIRELSMGKSVDSSAVAEKMNEVLGVKK